MKRLAAVLSACFVLTLAADAAAGPRIVTPRILPPSDGSLICTAVNASAKKSITVQFTIYKVDGTVVSQSPIPLTLPPNGTESTGTNTDLASHCAVEVLKGGKKNVRVSLYATNSSIAPIAAVAGH